MFIYIYYSNLGHVSNVILRDDSCVSAALISTAFWFTKTLIFFLLRLAMAIVSEFQDWMQSCLRPSTKLKYLTDSWNRLDIIIVVFYVVGLIFRMM